MVMMKPVQLKAYLPDLLCMCCVLQNQLKNGSLVDFLLLLGPAHKSRLACGRVCNTGEQWNFVASILVHF